jgi:D-cysteine desulfhydrase
VDALIARWPRLAETLPRVNLEVRATPIEQWDLGGVALLAKRDDLSTPTFGGNKARALELLLAGVAPGDVLLTVGSSGSTHALAVALFGEQLGARTRVFTWPQEEHDVSRETAERLQKVAQVTASRTPVTAMLRASLVRLMGGVRWVPAGGSNALGALGHANAAVELADQLARASLPAPDTLVVPLGSGGTAAGLMVGLALAGLPTRVLGVRVVPRVVANRRRVMRLARAASARFGELAGVAPPEIREDRLVIEQSEYGGAYARETETSRAALALVRAAGGPSLEGTYSAKALAGALRRARRSPEESILFWLTFDGRWLGRP